MQRECVDTQFSNLYSRNKVQELEIQLAARSAECLDLKLQLSKVQELETRLAERSKERCEGCHDLRLQVAQEASVEEEEGPVHFFVCTRHGTYERVSVCAHPFVSVRACAPG